MLQGATQDAGARLHRIEVFAEPRSLLPTQLDAPANRLLHGDNLDVLHALRGELAGKIDLVYMDPPFATGGRFAAGIEVGERDLRGDRSRTRALAEDLAYSDRWEGGIAGYLGMLRARLVALRPLLSESGSVFVHLDRRVAHHAKLLLDEVFGADRMINEIVWCYTGPSSPGLRSFANKHDLVFWYANGPRWTFHADRVRLPYKESTRRNEGRRTGFTTGNPDLVVTLHPLGKFPEDWWLIPVEAPASSRRTAYPTQKPERLLERILLAASNEGDLVADFFCGSGTTLAVAERLGRRWIGCDSSRLAVHTTRKRLLEAASRRAFTIERVGDAEDGAGAAASLAASLLLEGGRARVTLDRFEPATLESIPDAVRERAKKWSDFVDAWFVDWSWNGGPIAPAFAAYRTRKRRELPLSTPECELRGAAPLSIAVKVVDVLGRETVEVLSAAPGE